MNRRADIRGTGCEHSAFDRPRRVGISVVDELDLAAALRWWSLLRGRILGATTPMGNYPRERCVGADRGEVPAA